MYLLITMINLDIRSLMFTDLDTAIEAYRNSVDSMFSCINMDSVFAAGVSLWQGSTELVSKVIVD